MVTTTQERESDAGTKANTCVRLHVTHEVKQGSNLLSSARMAVRLEACWTHTAAVATQWTTTVINGRTRVNSCNTRQRTSRQSSTCMWQQSSCCISEAATTSKLGNIVGSYNK
jgi:hypothetical protein